MFKLGMVIYSIDTNKYHALHLEGTSGSGGKCYHRNINDYRYETEYDNIEDAISFLEEELEPEEILRTHALVSHDVMLTARLMYLHTYWTPGRQLTREKVDVSGGNSTIVKVENIQDFINSPLGIGMVTYNEISNTYLPQLFGREANVDQTGDNIYGYAPVDFNLEEQECDSIAAAIKLLEGTDLISNSSIIRDDVINIALATDTQEVKITMPSVKEGQRLSTEDIKGISMLNSEFEQVSYVPVNSKQGSQHLISPRSKGEITSKVIDIEGMEI